METKKKNLEPFGLRYLGQYWTNLLEIWTTPRYGQNEGYGGEILKIHEKLIEKSQKMEGGIFEALYM